MKNLFIILVLLVVSTINHFPQNQGDAYYLFINNIDMPLNRTGVIADVWIPPNNPGGKFNDTTFLFSAGFFLSGYADGQLWANAVASASLVEDYRTGRANPQPTDDP